MVEELICKAKTNLVSFLGKLTFSWRGRQRAMKREWAARAAACVTKNNLRSYDGHGREAGSKMWKTLKWAKMINGSFLVYPFRLTALSLAWAILQLCIKLIVMLMITVHKTVNKFGLVPYNWLLLFGYLLVLYLFVK